MINKIKGEFLKIEKDSDHYYKIEYVNKAGKINWVRMDTEFISELAESAKYEVDKLNQQLSKTNDPKSITEIMSRIDYFTIQSIWPEMYIAYCRGENLNEFFEPKLHQQKSFGIPITAGKLLSKGKYGIVTSFNMHHLYVRMLYRAQLFFADRSPVTSIAEPHRRVTDIFDYPLMESSPEFAFCQKEYTAIVFINLKPA